MTDFKTIYTESDYKKEQNKKINDLTEKIDSVLSIEALQSNANNCNKIEESINGLISVYEEAGRDAEVLGLLDKWIENYKKAKSDIIIDDLSDNPFANNTKEAPVTKMLNNIKDNWVKKQDKKLTKGNIESLTEDEGKSEFAELQNKICDFLVDAITKSSGSVDVNKANKGIMDILGNRVDRNNKNTITEVDSLIRKCARESNQLSFVDQCKGYVKKFLVNIGVMSKTNELQSKLDAEISNLVNRVNDKIKLDESNTKNKAPSRKNDGKGYNR